MFTLDMQTSPPLGHLTYLWSTYKYQGQGMLIIEYKHQYHPSNINDPLHGCG